MVAGVANQIRNPLAAICAVGFRILWANGMVLPDNTSAINMLQLVFWIGMELNIVLLIFNLIPIPPLDGSHVLFDLLDPRTAHELREFMNQYGLILLIAVIIFARGIIGPIMNPILSFLAGVPVG